MDFSSWLFKTWGCFLSISLVARHPVIYGDQSFEVLAWLYSQMFMCCAQTVSPHAQLWIFMFLPYCSSFRSAQDWRYAAKQLIKKYPQDVIVHCEFCDP